MILTKTNGVEAFTLKHKPCAKAQEWLEANNITSMVEAWNRCERGDCLLWTLQKVNGATLAQYREIAISCAEHVEPLYNKRYPDDKRVHDLNVLTRKYLAGKATLEELMKARRAPAADAYAADAYADAAYADAAADAARLKERKWQANKIRKIVSNPFEAEA